MKIWKFSLDIIDQQTIAMPLDAKILTVQMQMGGAQLWALCNENQTQTEDRSIAIYGTGNPMPEEPGEYIATFQGMGGALVWHAFELP